MRATRPRSFVPAPVIPLVLATIAAACGPEAPLPGDPPLPLLALEAQPSGASDLRIAIVGAGASGLTAAHTLKELGYRNVTVFEKESDVGGKIQSLRVGELRAELGAVFTSPDYRLTLDLADRFGVPYVRYDVPRYVLDGSGHKRTFQEFLVARYTPAEIARAIENYALVLQRFPQINQDGFANLPADLAMTFDRFAAKYGFVPVAEVARSLMTGFGYDYYETVPAAYVMKLLPWLVKLGPAGLESPPYFVFPGGFQSLWRAVATPLDVRLRTRVARIERRPADGQGERNAVRLTLDGGERREFDAVIVSAPLDVVPKLVALPPAEQALFAKVTTSRYFVTLFVSVLLAQAETVFVHEHGRPQNINHVSVWGNPGGNGPVFIGYQLADRNTNGGHLFGTLALDVFNLGGGLFAFPLLQKEWSYFPRVGTGPLQDGFFDKLDAVQGAGGVYFVGSGLSFETVEHTARFARSLVRRHFPAVGAVGD